jgi:hypothetical protein
MRCAQHWSINRVRITRSWSWCERWRLNPCSTFAVQPTPRCSALPEVNRAVLRALSGARQLD